MCTEPGKCYHTLPGQHPVQQPLRLLFLRLEHESALLDHAFQVLVVAFYALQHVLQYVGSAETQQLCQSAMLHHLKGLHFSDFQWLTTNLLAVTSCLHQNLQDVCQRFQLSTLDSFEVWPGVWRLGPAVLHTSHQVVIACQE